MWGKAAACIRDPPGTSPAEGFPRDRFLPAGISGAARFAANPFAPLGNGMGPPFAGENVLFPVLYKRRLLLYT